MTTTTITMTTTTTKHHCHHSTSPPTTSYQPYQSSADHPLATTTIILPIITGTLHHYIKTQGRSTYHSVGCMSCPLSPYTFLSYSSSSSTPSYRLYLYPRHSLVFYPSSSTLLHFHSSHTVSVFLPTPFVIFPPPTLSPLLKRSPSNP